jgi:guanylate kinase
MDNRRLILVGKAASGKDYARQQFENFGYRYCVSHTTRPPRKNELNGVDYYFISLDSAIHHYVAKNLFYEYVEFNGWIYGTSLDEFEKSNLFIMTPGGINKLKPDDRKESFIVYIDILENIRRERLLKRNDADNVDRRLAADERDFENFTDFDYRINDPNFIIDSEFVRINLDKQLKN